MRRKRNKTFNVGSSQPFVHNFVLHLNNTEKRSKQKEWIWSLAGLLRMKAMDVILFE